MPRVTISEPGKTPQPYRFKLERKVVKIGRSSESDIVVECGSASTNHCTMERVEGGFILRDNNSTNGIKQDDTMMSIIDLFDGMEVLIGDIPMAFELSEEEINTLSSEEFSTHQQKKLPPKKDEDAPRRPQATTSSPRASSHRPPPKVQSSPPTMNAFLVFILMIAGIIAGLSIRHYRETGDFLVSKWIHGTEQKTPENQQESDKQNPEDKTPEDKAEDEPETPAPAE